MTPPDLSDPTASSSVDFSRALEKHARPDDSAPAHPPLPENRTGVERFFHTFSPFMASFVIGLAGLIATSMYQCKQATVAQQQAEANVKLEKMRTLTAHLAVLGSNDPKLSTQQCALLRALTASKVMEGDAPVPYALEMGRYDSSCMKDVLSAVPNKNYTLLASHYIPTCEEKYGVSARDAELYKKICPNDQWTDRSDKIAQMIAEDSRRQVGKPGSPQEPLRSEREVQLALIRMTGVYGPLLTELYINHQAIEINDFMNFSVGARLVGSLMLPIIATEDISSRSNLDEFRGWYKPHADWLLSYVTSGACATDCRLKVIGFILSNYKRAPEFHVQVLQRLLRGDPKELSPQLSYLSSRLMSCQIDKADETLIAEQVLLPLFQELLLKTKPDQVATLQPWLLILSSLHLPEPIVKAESLPAVALDTSPNTLTPANGIVPRPESQTWSALAAPLRLSPPVTAGLVKSWPNIDRLVQLLRVQQRSVGTHRKLSAKNTEKKANFCPWFGTALPEVSLPLDE